MKSVLVRGRSARINPDPKELVLLSFSVDLSEEKAVPETGSLVINDKGQVIYTSANNIAPRVGFFGDPNKKQEALGLRKPEDEIFGPVKYVKVYISPEAYPGSMTSSDFRGKYSMSFMLPYCPGGMEYTTDIWAELHYANFSPFGSPTIPYNLRRQDWTYCYDLPPFVGTSLGAAAAYMNAMGSLATLSIPIYNADFRVDVMFLSGRILLRNPDGSAISVGNDTQYHVASANNTTQAQAFYDFDGDGKSDLSVVGDIKDEVQPDGTVKKVFVQQNNGPYQGVYFSSQKKPDGTPNVIRLADKGDRLKPNGLLKSISKDDLKNTDIYVFRESTGQLVLERNGLKDEEIAGRVDIGLGKNDQYYYYRLMLRGPMDSAINVGGINRGKNWEEWAEEYRLAEPFRKRESDYLKSGEWVRLVVINRATGYMGTQRIQLGDASKNAGSTLSVKLDDTWLQPPNLKIWAERDYTQTSGLEQNKQQKNNIIGMEGASLDSDDIIRVYTEWLDEEGRPLPEGLSADNGEQYGLTGRLAKVGSPNQLVSVAAGSLASFAIAPGMNTQVLRLKDNLTAPEHFYVHVVGMQKDENPDFGTDPTEAPPLDTRPKNATPFLVPIYDENKHWQTWSAWNQLKRAYDAEELDEEPLKPKGSYVWHVRPEYQFSQLALEIQKIEREYTTESGDTKTQELLIEQNEEGKIPTIRANDDLVRVFYSLIGNSNNPLLPIDGEQELVFGFGASEVRATISANGEIVFKDLSHIDSLDPTDLLTLRLYVNHDAGNTLWEWAFTRNGLHVYYEVPGNTQEKSKRALPTVADVNCSGNTCSDIEILALLATEDTNSSPPAVAASEQPAPKVRTLGGMRLRLRYIPPNLDGIKITKVTWKMGHKGRYCNQYGVTTAGCNVVNANQEYEQTHPYTPVLPTETGDWSVYWEPVSDDQNKTDWSNWAGTETDDKGVASSLNAEYTVPVKAGSGDTPTSKVQTRRFAQDFTLHTRELKPATGTEKPMQGSDVAMLEAMLWQLGISPQHAYTTATGAIEGPGSTGTRLGEHSSTLGSVVGGVSGTAGRSHYSLGMSGVAGSGSFERMVKRFQGRNISANEGDGEINGGSTSNGVVNDDVLAQLARVWTPYWHSYKQHRSSPVIAITDPRLNGPAGWLASAVTIWESGLGSNVPVSYTRDKHNEALRAAGKPDGWKSRDDLLRVWKIQEASRGHWGRGAPQTNYRMTEGGSDEMGSLSFNQVLYRYRYSDEPCTVHSGSGLNFYDPLENAQGFAMHTSAKATTAAGEINCQGSFNKAYAAGGGGYSSLYNLPELRGYSDAGAVQAIGSQDDAYEVLAKAIAAYNGGNGFDKNRSWPRLLKETRKPVTFINTTAFCVSCGYAIQVLKQRYGLDYRTYIWEGGQGVDINGDGLIQDIAADPTVTPPVVGVVETTVPWCFAYGESEWVAGQIYGDVRTAAIGNLLNPPVGRVACP